MNPRCPECDIELDCSDDKWVCPLCHQTPKSEQYVQSSIPAFIRQDPLALRDLATAAAALIQELVAVEPALAATLERAYHKALDIAERADQDGHSR